MNMECAKCKGAFWVRSCLSLESPLCIQEYLSSLKHQIAKIEARSSIDIGK